MNQYFNASTASSQWGQIRKIAMVSDTYDNLRSAIVEFITKGLRKDFWRGKPGTALMKYLDVDLLSLLTNHDVDRYAPMAVVNLASVMAAKSKRSGKFNDSNEE